MSGIFDHLSEKLADVAKFLKKQPKITEIHISDEVKDLRKALIDADVHYKVAKDFAATIKEKVLGADILKSVKPEEVFLKQTYETLVDFLGKKTQDIQLTAVPTVLLMVGTQGVGKTTHTAKVGLYFKQKNKKVLLIACDIYRPAAVEQLKILGEQNQMEVYFAENKSPLAIAEEGLEYAKKNGFQLVIIDTAGRTSIDAQMMEEIRMLKENIKPQKTFFVLDAVMGQDAVNVAKEFNETVSFDAVILTKMDDESGARGGSALSIQSILQKPIQFIGTGEKIDALSLFHPDRMASRILGKGDILSFVEQINQKIDLEKTAQLQKKIIKNGFDCNAFLEQIQQIKKMGDLNKLMKMIPGAGKMLGDMPMEQNPFKELEAIIHSMTPTERVNCGLLTKEPSRKQRIAKGSGTTVEAVGQFLKQMEQMSKMMKMMGNQKGGFSQIMGMMSPGKMAQMQNMIKK